MTTTIALLSMTIIGLAISLQAVYNLRSMLYAWNFPNVWEALKAPRRYIRPQKSFTVLLPARHEEDVIQQTIERVVGANYPARLLEIVVICEAGDSGTIAEAQEKIAELERNGTGNVKLITFDDLPINKPHGLNVGFSRTRNEVVTIFDAEDDVHPDIFNVVNTVMVQDNVNVVQSGVQLMNFDSSWYSLLNVLEYYFWFKSCLPSYANQGVIPLGGNTVFFKRSVMEELVGWDSNDLTEDADVGIRLSASGTRVRIIYDAEFVTKEETPTSFAGFIRQRTRWSQGFLQTLKKGAWKQLPTWQKRSLALYILGFPTVQSVLAVYVPISIWMMFTVKVPVAVALILLFPSYLLIAHYIILVIGLYEFAEEHKRRVRPHLPLVIAAAYIPYQWVLSYAALRAVWRELRGKRDWEKTAHTGAHRG